MEFNENVTAFMKRMEYCSRYLTFSCVGLSSQVIKDGESMGHVLMIDAEALTYYRIKKYCNKVFDSYFIFQSSPGSYHVLNPVVRSLEDTYDILTRNPTVKEMEHEPHADIGYKRGDWVLRITDKPDKAMPELLFSRTHHNEWLTYSKPHLKFIEKIHNSSDAKNLQKMPCVGDTLRTVKYWTFK